MVKRAERKFLLNYQLKSPIDSAVDFLFKIKIHC